jgi:hypothetical protein
MDFFKDGGLFLIAPPDAPPDPRTPAARSTTMLPKGAAVWEAPTVTALSILTGAA